MLVAIVRPRRRSEMRHQRPMVITSAILAVAVCMQMIACSKDDLRRSFSRNMWLHREYHFGPPKRTIRALQIDFAGETVEAVEGASILSVEFSTTAYQQAVQKYMEGELRGARLLDSSKPKGDVLNCRFVRVAARYIPEGFPLRKTAGEVELDCFLEKSGWRYSFTGRGKTSGQDGQSMRYSANIAIDDATQKLITGLVEQLGAQHPDQQPASP